MTKWFEVVLEPRANRRPTLAIVEALPIAMHADGRHFSLVVGGEELGARKDPGAAFRLGLRRLSGVLRDPWRAPFDVLKATEARLGAAVQWKGLDVGPLRRAAHRHPRLPEGWLLPINGRHGEANPNVACAVADAGFYLPHDVDPNLDLEAVWGFAGAPIEESRVEKSALVSVVPCVGNASVLCLDFEAGTLVGGARYLARGVDPLELVMEGIRAEARVHSDPCANPMPLAAVPPPDELPTEPWQSGSWRGVRLTFSRPLRIGGDTWVVAGGNSDDALSTGGIGVTPMLAYHSLLYRLGLVRASSE